MIPNTSTSQQILLNGTSTVFSYGNKIFAASDLQLTLIAPTTPPTNYAFVWQSGVTFYCSALAITATVQNVDVDTGCQVTLSSPGTSGWTLDMRSNVPETQLTSIKNQGAFNPELHEEAFDRVTRLIQDVNRRAYLFSVHGNDDESLPWPSVGEPAARANTNLGFGPQGQLTVNQNLASGTLSQSTIGQFYRPQLQGEVNVVNFFRDYFNVDRYGTNTTPGITLMASAVQSAVTSCLACGGGEITYGGAGGAYYLEAPINCTWQTSGAPGVRFRNLSPSQAQQHGFILGHNSIGFDCTGNDTIDMSDVVITTPIPIGSNPQPTIGILFARNVTNGGLHNQVKNVQITGCFSVAGIYNYGSEQFNLDFPWIYNYSLTPTAKAFIVTANNISNVQSIATCTTPGPNLGLNLIATGTQSMTIVDVRAPSFFMGGKSLGQDCIYLEGVAGYHQQGGWAANQQGRAIIAVDNSLAGTLAYTPTAWVSIRDFKIEHIGATALQPEYGIYFGASAGAVSAHTGWVVSGVHFDTAVAALATADGNTTLDGLHWDSCSEAQSNGLHITGILQGYSTLLLGASMLNLGTINNSWILGLPANINITSNSGGYVFPMGVASYAGWGTPTGAILTTNFPGASATLVQTSETLAYLINILKVWGLIAT